MSSKSYSIRDLPILSSFGLGSTTELCDPAKAKALFLNFLIAPVTWFFFFYLMGFLGGVISYWRFPRAHYDLPDVGFELFPEWCPSIDPKVSGVGTTAPN